MSRQTVSRIIWLALALALVSVPLVGAAAPPSDSVAAAPVPAASRPLFVENAGQFAPPARFLAQSATGYTWLAEDAIWISVYAEPDPPPARAALQGRRSAPTSLRGAAVRLSFAGANRAPKLVPSDSAHAQVSYLLGSDPAGWHAAVPVWHAVRYEELYPGIDLVFDSASGGAWRLEARAGADLSAVRLRIEGADSATLEAKGLRLATAAGEFLLPLLQLDSPRPAALVPTLTAPVQGALAGGPPAIELTAPFAPAAPTAVTASPAAATDLLFSTYLGGSSWEQGRAIAVGSDGSSYVTGETPSASFPLTPGTFDATMAQTEVFVTKLNAAGSALVYSTFVGGSGQEGGAGIAVDDSGQAWITGNTLSTNFPLAGSPYDSSCGSEGTCDSGAQGPYPDAFAAKLNATGTGLLYGTYLGGADEDQGYALAVDGSNAYVTGTTYSGDFVSGYHSNGDAFAVKLSSSGSLAYKVLLGGKDTDGGFGIAAVGGNAYVAGETFSSDFGSGYVGNGDAFVAKLNSNGSVAYRKLLGGGGWDRAGAVAVDTLSQAYIAGYTQSANFPVTSGTYSGNQDAFVAKLSSSSGVSYAAFLGGTGRDDGLAVALDSYGGFSAAGVTSSANFPTAGDPYAGALAGSSDAFVTRFDLASTAPDKRTYSTYLGGLKYDSAAGLAVDASGRAYLAGDTQSANFPVTGGAYDALLAGTQDGFVSKIAVARGNLQVTKTVNWNGVTPDPGQVFSICIAGPSYPGGNCQPVGHTGGTLTWNSLVPGSYTVSEADPGASWTVQVAGSPVTVPAGGGTGSATVTNTRKNGGLQVIKTVHWNGVTPQTAKTFEICISGPSYPAPGKNCKTAGYDGGTLVWTGLAPGPYSVTETDPGADWAYAVTGSPANVQTGSTVEAAVSNSRKLGSLEVTKSLDWNGTAPEADTFEICIDGPSYPTGNCKTIDAPGGVLAWSNLVPGSYNVSETSQPEWADAVTGSPATVPTNGGKATAAVANTRKLGSLQITKNIDWSGIAPVAGQTFEICIEGPSYPAAAECSPYTYQVSQVQTKSGLLPGEYEVTEEDPGTEWTVTLPPAVSVPVDGSQASASVSNTRKLGSLEVTKTLNWNGITPEDDSFEVCITGPSHQTTPGCKTITTAQVTDGQKLLWTNLIPGDYTLSETAQPEWSVTLPPAPAAVPTNGGTAAATVANTRKLGSLEVTKTVDWSGATPEADSFEICITGPSHAAPSCKSITAVDAQAGTKLLWGSLIPGSYTVSETAQPEWSVTLPPAATVPANGGTALAAVANTRRLGSLEVTKTVNWSGITPEPDSFQICIAGPSYGTPDCKTIAAADAEAGTKLLWTNLIPGSYTVTESAQPEWSTSLPSEPVTVPANGGTAAATVGNARKLGSLEVTKAIDWNGATAEPDSFEICITGPSHGAPSCQSITAAQVGSGEKLLWTNLLPGSYTVTETPQPEWSVSLPAPVAVGTEGATATAIVANTRKLGSLNVLKVVNWNGVAEVESQTFEICIKGPSYPLGTEQGACQVVGYNGGTLAWTGLVPGSYSVTETAPGSMWTVQVSSPSVSVPADGGLGSTTVTNTRKNGGLQVTKTVDWNGVAADLEQTFEICIEGPTYPDGDCKTTDYDGDTLIWSNLVPGEYLLTETDPGSAWTVVVDASPVIVPVDGTTAVASVTNTRKLGSLKVTKNVDWNGVTPVDGTAFTICITGPSHPTGSCKTFTYPSDLEKVWTDLVPGDYEVTETAIGTPGAAPAGQTGPAARAAGACPALPAAFAGHTSAARPAGLASLVPASPGTPVLTASSAQSKTCKTFTYPAGLVQTWTNLVAGAYTVTETDPGSRWSVVIAGSPALVPIDGGQANATVTNTRLLDRPPLPPIVTISASGTSATLTWSPVDEDVDGGGVVVTKYQVWRSNDPYFSPAGDPYGEVLTPDPLPFDITFTDAGVLADTGLNYYYIVRAVSDAGLSSADSNRTGEFGFTLVKGS